MIAKGIGEEVGKLERNLGLPEVAKRLRGEGGLGGCQVDVLKSATW
jgi:hypothetical protein